MNNKNNKAESKAEFELIYGVNAIYELLLLEPSKVNHLYLEVQRVQPGKKSKITEILTLCEQHKIQVFKLDKNSFMAKFGDLPHQGIAAYFKPKGMLHENELLNVIEDIASPLILILDGVQDPNNLGACIRVSEAAGVDLLIIPKNNSASITPAVRKVASGATESLNIMQVTNIARTMQTLQEHGVWIVGTSLDTTQSLYQVDLTGKIAIIMGGEADGIRQLTAKNCDFLVKLPMKGKIQSLNVATATGICLFEAVRQRIK
jgi:23S rRNA (guanosine2251-2'-O)-methyltransferase